MADNQIQREVIQVTTQDRIQAAERYPLIDPRVQVLTLEEIEGLQPSIEFRGVLKPGAVFIRHPFRPNVYIDASYSEIEIIRERLQCIGEIVQALGAYQYQYKVKRRECRSRDLQASANLRIGAFKAKGKFRKECQEVLDDSSETCEQYEAKVPADAVARAWEIARRYGLDCDPEVCHLIEIASSENRSQIVRTVITATKGTESSMDAAFSLKTMQNAFGISAHVIENIQYKKTLTVMLIISFSKESPVFKINPSEVKEIE